MLKNLLLVIVATILYSCGSEIDNAINDRPDNSNYFYTSHVKYYRVPNGEVDKEQDFSGYISMSVNPTVGTGTIELQPEYGENWSLNLEDLLAQDNGDNLFTIPEQTIKINNENYSVKGLQVITVGDTEFHVRQTSDSLFVKYSSFYPGTNSDYRYTEGEIKGRKF